MLCSGGILSAAGTEKTRSDVIMLRCGIVGLPLSGKTTVFNVITRAGAEVKAYAGGKTDPNRAMVAVPDERFDRLVHLFQPKKEAPAVMEFVDLAGLSRGAGKGAGLGNAFLSFVGDADALVHVVRCFDNPDVPHPEESVDPLRDWQIVEMELIFRDLGVIENRLSRLGSKKRLLPEEEQEKVLLERCQAHLMEERPLRELAFSPEEARSVRGFAFVTRKPELVVLNLDESQTDETRIPGWKDMEKLTAERGLGLVRIYGRMEMDMADLAPEEQEEFMKDLGVAESGRNRLIARAYGLLGLISFFTTGLDEVKAWTLRKGDTALAAAGTIHSDLARGFIRAQVVSYEDFCAHGESLPRCREAGVLRLEGRDYLVADGDMIEIRFNV
jgi:hypothetical protein